MIPLTPFAADAPTPAAAPTPDADWRLPLVVVTSPDERTCLECGETFVGAMCYRCGMMEPGAGTWIKKPLPPSVPTLSYLRPGEYRIER